MNILYEDAWMLVCEKEANVPVQSSRVGVRDMVSILKNYRKEKEGMLGEPYLGVIHRLDQPVQGVIVFAKTREAAAKLSAQARGDAMKKEYLAVACGQCREKEGVLVDYLVKDGRTNTSRIGKAGEAGAKEARLDYRILREEGGHVLVSICLHTGRHHQIRVQMAHAGMPLAGDRKYQPQVSWTKEEHLALCACQLTLRHPKTGKRMTFRVEPKGAFFEKFCQKG